MPLVSFQELMVDAERGGYAVGYFESWNLESLQGVVDAAEAVGSPVILGFSGLSLPDSRRMGTERLELYASLGLAACATARVPTALIFNESPELGWVKRAVELGFNVVMFADERLPLPELRQWVMDTVAVAAGRAAVEAELESLAGIVDNLSAAPEQMEITDPDTAAEFVAATGVDALAISIGNVHLHGRRKVGLDLERLRAIRERVRVPLVLHGASSIEDEALRQAIRWGIRKINVGSVLRSAFYRAVRERIAATSDAFSPYEVVGSGLPDDVLLAGRLALRDVVVEKMRLFGSAGRC
jgi:ketose-bisphosphate aldolase